jgi:hypothetical protein
VGVAAVVQLGHARQPAIASPCDPSTRQWHELADVWKTHVAFMSPILATAADALVVY